MTLTTTGTYVAPLCTPPTPGLTILAVLLLHPPGRVPAACSRCLPSLLNLYVPRLSLCLDPDPFADKAPVDEHHPDMALTTIPAPEEGEVVGGRAIMSVQQRMKQALKMRAVWAGFLLIVIA